MNGTPTIPHFEVVKKLKIRQNLFPPVSPAPVFMGRPCGELPVMMENIGQNEFIHNLFLSGHLRWLGRAVDVLCLADALVRDENRREVQK
jgi:hypothetical protein